MSVCIKSLIKNMNLVVGCPIGCPYCYARNNCRRFHMSEDFNSPVFFERKLHLIETRKSTTWLMTGLSDFSVWKKEWRDEIFSLMAANSQHRYLFLTKRPEDCDFATDLDTVWMGVTVTRKSELKRIADLKTHIRAAHYHVTFEPLFEDLGPIDLGGIDWVVIGTETGKRKGKVDARPEWVLNIAHQCEKAGIPYFMKEDLLPIMGEERMVQQLDGSFV